MNYFLLKNNIVVNRIKANADFTLKGHEIAQVGNLKGSIGDACVDGVVSVKPSEYHLFDGAKWVISDDDMDIKNFEEALQIRSSGIKNAQKGSFLKTLSVDGVEEFVDSQMNSVVDIETAKQAVSTILKEMITHLLK